MTSIRDVAKMADVSIATVSRYLSTPDKVSKHSAAKVERAIVQLNYKPNLLARNFFKTRSYSILVLVPDIANPFFSKVIRGIEDAGQQKGYAVLLGDTRYSRERENEYFRRAETRQADGVIQLSPFLPSSLSISGNKETGTSIPFVNACEIIDNPPCPTVSIDNTTAFKNVVEYLMSMGHKRIGCVLGPSDSNYISPLTRDRLAGYQQALAQSKISVDEKLLVAGDFSMRSGLNAAPYFMQLNEKPTAICCMNDEMAIGLIQGLKAEGVSIPGDISVTGFDDIGVARYCDPPLTTIAQPAEDIGRTAMNVLSSLLEGQAQTQTNHLLPTEFIVRNSVASV